MKETELTRLFRQVSVEKLSNLKPKHVFDIHNKKVTRLEMPRLSRKKFKKNSRKLTYKQRGFCF